MSATFKILDTSVFQRPICCLLLVTEACERRRPKGIGSCKPTQCAPRQMQGLKFHGKRDQAGQRYGLSRAEGAEGSRNVLKSTSKHNQSVGALIRAPLNTIHHLESS